MGENHALQPGASLNIERASGRLFHERPESLGQVRTGILLRLAKRLAFAAASEKQGPGDEQPDPPEANQPVGIAAGQIEAGVFVLDQHPVVVLRQDAVDGHIHRRQVGRCLAVGGAEELNEIVLAGDEPEIAQVVAVGVAVREDILYAQDKLRLVADRRSLELVAGQHDHVLTLEPDRDRYRPGVGLLRGRLAERQREGGCKQDEAAAVHRAPLPRQSRLRRNPRSA